MVFYAFTLVMKPRNRKATTQALKEIATSIYNAGGQIRKFSNEGIIRPYSRFRDTNNEVLTYARYITVQVDLGEEECRKFQRATKQHPDVFTMLTSENLEKPLDARKSSTEFFPMDTFSRMEEEIHWPPQVSADLYEQLDMNWKEFSRTRWSNYLRN